MLNEAPAITYSDIALKQTVYIVDDDPAIGEALHWLLDSVHIHSEIYTSAEEFLKNYNGVNGCLVTDIRMRGMSGLKLQERLKERGIKLPVIFISGHGDIDMAVRTMKMGAVDFLTKPFNNQALLESIQTALEKNAKQEVKRNEGAEILERADSLTPREYQVMVGVVSGKISKAIAEDLGISPHTVELHRAKVMRKMKVRTLGELIKLALTYDLVKK